MRADARLQARSGIHTRRERSGPRRITLPMRAASRLAARPAVVFVTGFVGFILAGGVVLSLPVASAAGQWTPPMDALFTATSAICVTGLVVVDTGTYWSTFGQIVILVLIQLGGFGYMTSSTLLLLLLRRRASMRERILLQEELGRGGLGSVLQLARRVILLTLVVEVVGAVVLTLAFLRVVAPPQAAWWGVFHSVSAFNNAGFDLTGEFRSLVPFNDQPAILLPIAGLLICGGISFTVIEDLRTRRGWRRLTVDSKLVLLTSAALIAFGTLGVLLTERVNAATLGEMAVAPRLLNAFFTAVTPRTAGFNSLNTGAMTESGLFLLIALMFIGGAAGSTAGGIKIQTFSVLFFAIVSTVRGRGEVECFGRRVPTRYLLRAIAVALLSMALVFTVAFALTFTEQRRFLDLLFEAFSAFGTVGMSTGLTPDLSAAGRVIVAVTMFAGRLGPLTLVLALTARDRQPAYRWPEEGIRIG